MFGSRLSIAVGLLCVVAPPAIGHAQTVLQSSVQRAASTLVMPGDRILLHVVREPELNDSIFVTERGDAAFPKLGRLQVASLTIRQLQDTLIARYSEYL